jgi:hypothetical protein
MPLPLFNNIEIRITAERWPFGQIPKRERRQMRDYNKNYVKCFLLIELLTLTLSPSPLPLCGIPTSIFFVKTGRDVSGEREIFELRHSLMAEEKEGLSS